MNEKMTISRLAVAAGVNKETVRFYQRHGLIDEPAKPETGYRLYEEADVHRILFIKRAQVLGFTLHEIAALLTLEESRACTETRDLASKKLALVEGKLLALQAMQRALKEMIGRCDASDGKSGCPMIRALAEGES